MKIKFGRRPVTAARPVEPAKPKRSAFDAPPRPPRTRPTRLYSLQLSRPYSADQR